MRYLTVGEVAERLCVSKAAVYALCSRDGAAIRHLRLGAARTTIRIPAEALDEFISGATVEPSQAAERHTATAYVPKHLEY